MKKIIFALIVLSLFVVACTNIEDKKEIVDSKNSDLEISDSLPVESIDVNDNEELAFDDSDLDEVSSLMNEW